MSEQYNLRGKRSDEQILLILKQHLWTLMPIVWAWMILITAIILVVARFDLPTVDPYAIFGGLVVGLLFGLYRWFIWNSSNYIITNQRVIKVDQNGFFNRAISEAEIGRIQEISTEIKGPVRTIFNFGRVKIQTASRFGRVDLEDVADPYEIQQEIVRLQRSINDSSSIYKSTLR